MALYIFSPHWCINNDYPSQQLNVVLRHIRGGNMRYNLASNGHFHALYICNNREM